MTTASSQITSSSIATSTAKTAAQTSASNSSTGTGSSSSTGSAAKSLGETDFLTLLVAQLKHQDPLNPQNPSDFTAELAQFSSLEQLTNLNTSVNNMVSSTNNSTDVSALNLIGKQVTYSSSNLTYNGSPMQVGYTLSGSGAAQVQVLIQNSSGQTVKVLNGSDLTTGNHMLTWDGTDQSGNSLSSGAYTIAVQAVDANGSAVTSSPLITSQVTGVDMSNSSGALINTVAGDIAFNKILGVASAGSSATSILGQTSTSSTSSSTESSAAAALAASVAQTATSASSSLF